ncbi:MAG TPA: GNAT family N-acetyltransferase [Chitinophagaceae bacterium]|nr:GNAT family N-acetyltransferase [Chitinophagaceae bacterium]
MLIINKSWEELTCSELYAILQIRAQVFVVEQECPYLDLDDMDQNSRHLFIIENQIIVAYIRIILEEKRFKIGRVATRKEYRSKGLASALMQAVMNWIKNQESDKKIQLSAQKHLVDFYAQWGFVSDGKTYLEVGIPHEDMEYQK